MAIMRPQWPHTINDIVKAIDNVWGLVGATTDAGQLIKLEKSLKEPVEYTLTEYEGTDESKIAKETRFAAGDREAAIKAFAKLLGFTEAGA
ncbi:MAG: hypothetical protein K2W82_13200 [Candidatus Obscuribacterales bacterium]|nr:hypothetical protein [Candidatus Obscuribacterales bacterium]